MERSGDRGYKLTSDEHFRIVHQDGERYDLLKWNGSILREINDSILQSGNSYVDYTRTIYFSGKSSMRQFEDLCRDINPPIEIPLRVHVRAHTKGRVVR